jgi:hypothetical protein
MFFFFGDTVSLCSSAQVVLQLSILLLQPPECWDFRCMPSHSASGFLLKRSTKRWINSHIFLYLPKRTI